MHGSARRVEAWSALPMNFQPKDWRLAYRTDLRALLRSIDHPGSGELLVAKYSAAPGPNPADLENILFYNISTPLPRLIDNGTRFERDFVASPAPTGQALPHYVRYEVGTQTRSFEHWNPTNPIGEFTAVFPNKIPTSIDPIFMAIRHQSLPPAPPSVPPSGCLGAHIRITSARSVPVGSVVKVVLDAIISAFHQHDGSNQAELVRRMEARGVGSRHDLSTALLDPAWASLGTRRLVGLFGATGYKWNPADDGLVAVQITVEMVPDAAAAVALTGSLFTVRPASE